MSGGVLALALGIAAFAAEPEEVPAEESAAPEQEEAGDDVAPVMVGGIEEITVYAEERVRQARQQVADHLEHLGYEQVEKVGDREVYRHTEPWKGEVVLHDDGWTLVRRQPLRVEGRAMPWTKANTAVAWTGCLIYPWLCIRIGGATVSKAKWRAMEGRTVEEMHVDVRVWNDRIADLHTREKVARLPDALEALWERGQPLEVGLGEVAQAPMLATMTERRRALFDYWDSRTDTVWGEEVRATLEGFCRAVVMRSEDPFTDAELAAWNQTRQATQPFDPWRRREVW